MEGRSYYYCADGIYNLYYCNHRFSLCVIIPVHSVEYHSQEVFSFLSLLVSLCMSPDQLGLSASPKASLILQEL